MSPVPLNVSTHLAIAHVHRRLPRVPGFSLSKMSPPIRQPCEALPARYCAPFLLRLGPLDPADCRKPPLSLDDAAAPLRATDWALLPVFCAPRFARRPLLADFLSQDALRSAGDVDSKLQGTFRCNP